MSSALSTHLASGAPLVMLAAGADVPRGPLRGADAIFIDREGTGLSFDTAQVQMAAARRAGLFTVLRVDGTGADELGACLRLAPDALILPQITGAVQLAALVAQAQGSGVGLIAQIETVQAVESIDALIAVDGIAGFLIGPFDLARAMQASGPDDPDVATAVLNVATRLQGAGRVWGLPTLSPAAHHEWTGRGAQLLYVTLSVFQTEDFQTCLNG